MAAISTFMHFEAVEVKRLPGSDRIVIQGSSGFASLILPVEDAQNLAHDILALLAEQEAA